MTPAKRKGSRVTPKKHTPPKPTSRTNAKATSRTTSKTTKGKVPVAVEPSRPSLLSRLTGRETKVAPTAPGNEPGIEPAPAEADAPAPARRIRPPRLDAEGNPIPRPPYGAWAIVIAFAVGQILYVIAYAIAQATTDYDFTIPAGVGAAVGQAAGQAATGQAIAVSVPPPLWLQTLLQLGLWAGIGLVPIWFAVKKGKGVVADLGLRMKAIDVPVGLAIGAACQLVMVPVLYWLIFKAIGQQDVSAEARELTDRATDPLSIVLVFAIVIVGAPLAEEIYFRGMAQRIFARRIRPHWAILASASFFAASHLQPLQFPALLVFGLILGYLAWKMGRLGTAIWAHVGFNLVTAVGLIFHVGWW